MESQLTQTLYLLSAVDFDEDDPLAGLLSDEEDEKPKPKPSLKKALPKQDSMDSVDSDKSQGM
jgi:hypothetical protein